MKLCSSLFIYFLLLVLLAYLSPAKATMGGCFQRDDFIEETVISEHPSCLQIITMAGCLQNIELYISSTCDEVFTYEKEGVIYEIYKHENWLKEYPNNSRAVSHVTDRTVPQEFGSWSKEIGYKDDPTRKITVDVTVKSREAKILYNKKFWQVVTVLTLVVTVVATVTLGIKLLNKLAKRRIKKTK